MKPPRCLDECVPPLEVEVEVEVECPWSWTLTALTSVDMMRELRRTRGLASEIV